MKVRKQKETLLRNESLKSNKIASDNVKALISNFNEKTKSDKYRFYPIAKKEEPNKIELLNNLHKDSGKRNNSIVDYENCVKVSDLLSKKPGYEHVIRNFEKVLSRPRTKLKHDISILKSGPSNTTPQNIEPISVSFKVTKEASLNGSDSREAIDSLSSKFLSQKCSTSRATSTSVSSVQLRSLNVSNSNNRHGLRSSATSANSQDTEKIQGSLKKTSFKSSSCCTNKSSSLLGTGWKYFNLMRLCSKSVKINKDFL